MMQPGGGGGEGRGGSSYDTTDGHLRVPVSSSDTAVVPGLVLHTSGLCRGENHFQAPAAGLGAGAFIPLAPPRREGDAPGHAGNKRGHALHRAGYPTAQT